MRRRRRVTVLLILLFSALYLGVSFSAMYLVTQLPPFPMRVTITYVVPTPTPMPLNTTSPAPYLICCPAAPEWGAQAAQQMQALRQRSAP